MTKAAILITGTFRETPLILKILSKMKNRIKYDIYLVLRHSGQSEKSRIGHLEEGYSKKDIFSFLENVFLIELPPIDNSFLEKTIMNPIGPSDREVYTISMYYGIFAGVEAIKSSGNEYTHVMKTRTDYIPSLFPWIDEYYNFYMNNNEKIIVDGTATLSLRYPDNRIIQWQGSISDQFSFSNYKQFLDLWDFSNSFLSLWTGDPHTTLFRSIFRKYLNDDLQSERRNNAFLKHFFIWQENDTKLSKNLLYKDLIKEDEIQKLLADLDSSENTEEVHKKILSKIMSYWKKNAVKIIPEK